MYDPDDKTDGERELECELKDAIMQLHTQFCAVTAGSAEQRMVRRQMNGPQARQRTGWPVDGRIRHERRSPSLLVALT
jgi:hypothetical protein